MVATIFRRFAWVIARGLLLVSLLISCAGCKKGVSHPKSLTVAGATDEEVATQDHVVILDDMRFVDISIPIGALVYEVTGGSLVRAEGVTVAHYTSKFSIDMLCDFYHLDMERLGWQEHASFQQPYEALILFEKPYRWCVVLMKHLSRGTEVSLHIRQKTAQVVAQGASR